MTVLPRRSLTILLGAAMSAPLRGARATDTSCCGPITSSGNRLAAFLDSTDVEGGWKRGWHVEWLSGQIDRAEPGGPAAATHCSAYVASVADRLGLYVLRPPQHPQQLLANAQMRWLRQDGAERGWQEAADYLDAQRRANAGELVLAVFEAPDPHKPGHIAVVRPSLKSGAAIEQEGPQVAMAGVVNYASTTMAHGFRFHEGAWAPGGQGAARFFAHPVQASANPGA